MPGCLLEAPDPDNLWASRAQEVEMCESPSPFNFLQIRETRSLQLPVGRPLGLTFVENRSETEAQIMFN